MTPHMLITSSWNDDKKRFFHRLSKVFEETAHYHQHQKSVWDNVAMTCNAITMVLTFTSICLELVFGRTEVTKYWTLSEKIVVMTVSSFVMAAGPSKVSRSHDKCRNNYLELVSRISTQINRDVVARKNFDLLLAEVKSKYDNTVEVMHPPRHLTFPTGIWSLSENDKKLLGSLYKESISDMSCEPC